MDSQSQHEESGAQPKDRFEIDFLDLLLHVAGRKRVILVRTVLGMGLTLVVTLLIKNSYISTAVILPPRQDTSVSALLSGQLGALSSLSAGGGLGSALNLKNPNEIYSGLLLSKTVGLDMVNRFDLMKVFDEKKKEDAIKKLASLTTIELSKDNLIRISVSTHDPNFSSQLANAYVDELHELNTHLALTDSSQRRIFFQDQLDHEKVLLANAESDLSATQIRTGVMQPAGQADMIARNISTLRAQITARDSELQALKMFDTAENPDYMRLSAQVASLRHELAEFENSEKSAKPGDIEIPTAKLPESALEYARKLREVRLHEEVYGLLVKQFEAAKIDEAKTAPQIQVVDRAVPAERKAGPHRLLITLGAGLFVFLASLFWTVLSYGFGLVESDPASATKLKSIRAALSLRN